MKTLLVRYTLPTGGEGFGTVRAILLKLISDTHTHTAYGIVPFESEIAEEGAVHFSRFLDHDVADSALIRIARALPADGKLAVSAVYLSDFDAGSTLHDWLLSTGPDAAIEWNSSNIVGQGYSWLHDNYPNLCEYLTRKKRYFDQVRTAKTAFHREFTTKNRHDVWLEGAKPQKDPEWTEFRIMWRAPDGVDEWNQLPEAERQKVLVKLATMFGDAALVETKPSATGIYVRQRGSSSAK